MRWMYAAGLAFAAGLPSEECIAISRHKVAAARGSLEQSARMQVSTINSLVTQLVLNYCYVGAIAVAAVVTTAY